MPISTDEFIQIFNKWKLEVENMSSTKIRQMIDENNNEIQKLKAKEAGLGSAVIKKEHRLEDIFKS